MLNVFRSFFSNRFCCGWISGGMAVFLVIFQLSYLAQWWRYVTVAVTLTIVYSVFRHLSFKYLDK